MADEKKPQRVWCDGCWDMMHFGHYNALRQAKELGDVLVVGVHSDAEILASKGPTVMNEVERHAMAAACRWADEVVDNAPYQTNLATLDANNIDFCVHGEDISTNADGTDSFAEVKEANRFKFIKRTEGISSTDLVGRMLLLTTSHFADPVQSMHLPTTPDIDAFHGLTSLDLLEQEGAPTNWHRLMSAMAPQRRPQPGDRIVYIPGGWDLLHYGHVEVLRKARALGDFLYCGVALDATLNARKGSNFPIMNLPERVLTVMGNRYVDEVIIGCPYHVTEALCKKYNVAVVVHGTDKVDVMDGEGDPFAYPKSAGIYQEVESKSHLSSTIIVERIIENRKRYAERNAKKLAKDAKANE